MPSTPLSTLLREAAMLLGEIRLVADVQQALSAADRERLRLAQLEVNRVRRVSAAVPWS